jgi:hypothetical protein
MNNFKIQDNTYLFFDIFFKDNKIYIILPIYNKPFNSNEITIYANNTILLVTEKYIHDSCEPISVYIYNYICESNDIAVVVKYNDIMKSYVLNHILSSKQQNVNISLTTLFKDDYNIFPLFYDYYKKQGITHFYMYYNGKITPEIRNIIQGENVTLIEWDYNYWNDVTICKYNHHAQMGQLNHALYRYGKNITNYMIFCDLDEYLYIPNYNIKTFINNNNDIDMFGFCNIWSNTLDNTFPTTFPSIFYTTNNIIPHGVRSKNIYKINSINLLKIHEPLQFSKKQNIITSNLYMYHFYNWGNKDRYIENCNIITAINI